MAHYSLPEALTPAPLHHCCQAPPTHRMILVVVMEVDSDLRHEDHHDGGADVPSAVIVHESQQHTLHQQTLLQESSPRAEEQHANDSGEATAHAMEGVSEPL